MHSCTRAGQRMANNFEVPVSEPCRLAPHGTVLHTTTNGEHFPVGSNKSALEKDWRCRSLARRRRLERFARAISPVWHARGSASPFRACTRFAFVRMVEYASLHRGYLIQIRQGHHTSQVCPWILRIYNTDRGAHMHIALNYKSKHTRYLQLRSQWLQRWHPCKTHLGPRTPAFQMYWPGLGL